MSECTVSHKQGCTWEVKCSKCITIEVHLQSRHMMPRFCMMCGDELTKIREEEGE